MRKHTARMRRSTTSAMTRLMTFTSCTEAMTRKAITKATILLMFFLVVSVFVLPTFSTPRILVFSKMAKTMVKISRKGRMTS